MSSPPNTVQSNLILRFKSADWISVFAYVTKRVKKSLVLGIKTVTKAENFEKVKTERLLII